MIDLADVAIPTFPIHVRRPDSAPLCGAAWTDTGKPYTQATACGACHAALHQVPEHYLAYQLGALVRGDAHVPWVALGSVSDHVDRGVRLVGFAHRIAARTAAEYGRRVCRLRAAVEPRTLLVLPVRAAGTWMLDDLVVRQVIARAPWWFAQAQGDAPRKGAA
jgi:hypothetical protein